MSKASEAGGYGWSHRRERERLLRDLDYAGVLPCSICGRDMTPDMELDLHHLEPTVRGGAQGPRRLAHARCNRGQGRALALGRDPAALPAPRPRREPFRCHVDPNCTWTTPHSRHW